MKNIILVDLDGTVIDSNHRTPTRSDGTLDLDNYLRLRTRDSIFKDKLLPLASVIRKLYRYNYIVISTARVVDQDDIDYLLYNNIPYHKLLSRPDNDRSRDADLKVTSMRKLRNLKQFSNKPWFMFDDAPSVISAMRKEGVRCLNSAKLNSRLLSYA